MKEKRRDYFLMAEVFRKIYLKNKEKPYQLAAQLFLDIVHEFMVMLEKDNPAFNRQRFISYIKEGR